ncbi:condensation domain-containing protein [Dactylosporangium sp. NBC_01737]|uniref:condensation domain-containing protein n=1 Tax=Dactylosporangium sp. NBC_01737 TaxID=2975959 RepID=UPI002E10934F|nr:condensation domain-containing protein [Dactylosporangium sp. NBC_01737]
MFVKSDEVRFEFAGDGSGVDDLAWGQQEIWLAMVRQRSWIPIGGPGRLKAGTTLDDVVDDLQYTLGRYQTMRTRLRFSDDGRVRQEVSARGEFVIEVFDAPDDADPDRFALALYDWFRTWDYDYVKDWPVRVGVVRQRGALTHQVTVASHLVTDALGGAIMMDEVTRREPAPVAGLQPLEQVRRQRSPAGQRQNEAALRYWRRQLRTIPARTVPESDDRCEPRYREGLLHSPAMHLALRAIVAREGVDPAAALLAVFAMAVVRVTGVDPVVIRPIVGNRFWPGLADVVCPVNQAGLCVVDIAGAPFPEVLDRVRRTVMSTYKYASFDPLRLAEAIADVERERGEHLDLSVLFNDRRTGDRSELAGGDASDVTLQRMSDALAQTRFDWPVARDNPHERLMVNVEDAVGAVEVRIAFDTHHIAPAAAEACVRGMQQVAVAAALAREHAPVPS